MKRRTRTVLHIGSDKTGTTSLQFRFAEHRERLAELGVDYPDIDGRPDHRSLAEGRESPPMFTADSEIDPDTDRTLVLSSEAFWPLPPGRVRSLLAGLPDGPVTIVAYLREPGSFVEAAFLQRCRMCSSERELFAIAKLLALPPAVNPIARRAVRRVAQLKTWIDSRGTADLIVRAYTPWLWPDGDITMDFCHASGLDSAAGLLGRSPNPMRNPTLGLTAIHASVLVRQRFGPEVQADVLQTMIGQGRVQDSVCSYTPQRLRDFARRKAEPLISELDGRFGDLSPLGGITDQPFAPAPFDRGEARILAADVLAAVDPELRW